MLERVISGAQTGADRAGLDAALFVGLKTGGWMPKGFIAQDGCHPEFHAKYNIFEHSSDRYPPRTAANVRDSDGTIRIATNWESPGEKLTMKMIWQYRKTSRDYIRDQSLEWNVAETVRWLRDMKIKTLNVAGNSERTSPGIYKLAFEFLVKVFEEYKKCSS